MRGRLFIPVALSASVLAAACGGLEEKGTRGRAAGGAKRTEEAARTPPVEGAAWTPPPGGACDCHGTLYATVEELIRRSDLIVIGQVEESVVGEVFSEEPGDEYPTITVHTTVAVEEALKGSARDGEVIVPTLELAFVGNAKDWRVGDHRVLLFLEPSPERDEPFFILSNISYWQTAYFVDGDDIEPGSNQDSFYRLHEKVARMTVPELRELVERVSA